MTGAKSGVGRPLHRGEFRGGAPQNEVGFSQSVASLPHRLVFDRRVDFRSRTRLFPACGVEKVDLDPTDIDGRLEDVARRSRDFGDDCLRATRESVEKAALAGIGQSGKNDLRPGTGAMSFLGLKQQRLDGVPRG